MGWKGRWKAEGERPEKATSGHHWVGNLHEIAGLVILSDRERKMRPSHTTKANCLQDL